VQTANTHHLEVSPDRWSLATRLGIAGAVGASWLVLRPYYGVIHDAQLYFHFAEFSKLETFQSLDIVVANDRQMGRSVFGRLLEPFVALMGIANAALALTVAGLVAWAGALIGLSRTLVGRDWWIVVIAVPAFSGYWGPLFLIAEPFATPRIFAEAAVIGGIAWILNGHGRLAVAATVVAMAIHPIIGLSGLAIVVIVAVIDHPRVVAGVVVVGAVGVVVAAWDPIGLAGATGFSAEWLSIIAERATLVLPGLWPGFAWVRTVFGFAVVGSLYLTSRHEKVRSLALASLIVSTAGLATSIVFSWLWVRPFITQLQPWRSLWILHLVAIVGVVIFSIDAARDRSPEARVRALAAWCLVLVLVTVDNAAWSAIVTLMMLPLLVPHGRFVKRLVGERLFVPILASVVGSVAVLQLVVAVFRVAMVDDVTSIPWLAYASHLPASSLFVAAILIGAVLIIRDRSRAALSALVILGVLAFGVVTWDHRTPWQAYHEALSEPIIALPDSAKVLVEHDSLATATLFRRPTFYSGYAGAGVVFSEPLALSYNHHAELARSLGIPYALNYRLGDIPYEDVTAPTPASLIAGCNDPSGPTHVFLRRGADGVPGVVWRSPVPLDDVPENGSNPAFIEDGFVLYTCADLVGK
jgi:hypothetical protein